MKRIITILICSLVGNNVFSQWTSATYKQRSPNTENYYKLDLNLIREQLKNAEETGDNAKPVEISLPTLNGEVENFKVYSFPVVVKSLAERYQLGSYVGVGIKDPSKYVRFSVSPKELKSMMIHNGIYEFIDYQNGENVYKVHSTMKIAEGESFTCNIKENVLMVKELKSLQEKGSRFNNQIADFSRASDKKFRTMRLALSVTGEYAQYFGGTVAGALNEINATMTRVNGIFEKDLALHLNVQDFPELIYTNPSTDPYSDMIFGVGGAWNTELQNTLTNSIGNANYDIGHLFSLGINGDAGCVGCVCVDPTANEPKAKGSAFSSSPAPDEDHFAIKIVTHEMGHQLGATHTFSNALYGGEETAVEPSSGSTIMAYAGTPPAVQSNPDTYFHYVNIKQIQTNLSSKDCLAETVITNNPPVIEPLINYTIPKGTAFALAASVTDPEGDAMTYTWEQMDNAESPVIEATGNNITGALFRSLAPQSSPIRYFPKLSSVLNGNLTTPLDWETVSNVARSMKFALTVRDNHPIANQQQTQSAEQSITVGNDGPFIINTIQANPNSLSLVEWDVVNTNTVPYNVSHVKIDYTTDNGSTWNVLLASTPNDGSENVSFPMSINNQTIKLRISAIENVFYAIQKVFVTNGICENTPPANITVSDLGPSSALLNWDPISNATYEIKYKKSSDTTWLSAVSAVNSLTLNDLERNVQYDVQIATVCAGTAGTFSNTFNFTTLAYCEVSSLDDSNDYIANVSLANINNFSSASTYTNYTTNSSLKIDLLKNGSYTLSIMKGGSSIPPHPVTIIAFIDFDNDGQFGNTPEEVIMFVSNNDTSNPVMSNFIVPMSAIMNHDLRMRVILSYDSSGFPPFPCGTFNVGEVEDYSVMITDVLSTNDVVDSNNSIKLYPNPVVDILHISKVSDKSIYSIYDFGGQRVGTGKISNNQINVSRLVQGGYIIVVEEIGKGISRFKFVKK
ncbi:T9SS C-terminal target domain-containing protein [Chryseobacterium nematophagum]|uniref:T9SS C-terminal target domain-containing protein n=1 Tax=Chryseobacterium nematophagum TaxID=2305228 RepID=A0A3M7L7U5_9FLAO|nr:zinc-dependent metalloprotease family protein [Chryseobacterium nematophagum]RMZ58074.1 T9SS C-terminal target domain-containing protein [Chryseobacterium nematophagum]